MRSAEVLDTQWVDGPPTFDWINDDQYGSTRHGAVASGVGHFERNSPNAITSPTPGAGATGGPGASRFLEVTTPAAVGVDARAVRVGRAATHPSPRVEVYGSVGQSPDGSH